MEVGLVSLRNDLGKNHGEHIEYYHHKHQGGRVTLSGDATYVECRKRTEQTTAVRCIPSLDEQDLGSNIVYT